MFQVIPKWKVTYKYDEGNRDQTVYLHDNHVGNVLRKAAEIDFSENGLLQPKEVVISFVR